MSLELTTLSFKVETGQIKEAVTDLNALSTALKSVNTSGTNSGLSGLGKGASEVSKDFNEVTQSTKKFSDENEKLGPTLSKVSKLIQHQSDTLKFLRNDQKYIEDGFTRSQASLMATAQAAGATSNELQVLANVFKDISKVTGKNPFDQSASGLGQLKQQALEMTNVADYLAKGLNLTGEQIRLLTRDQLKLVDSMKQQGRSNSDIMRELDLLETQYLDVAASVNHFVAAGKELERRNKLQNQQLAENITMMDQAVTQFRKLENQKAEAAQRAAQKIVDANQTAIQSVERLAKVTELMKSGMTQQEAGKRVDLAASGVELANIEKLIAAEKELSTVKYASNGINTNVNSTTKEAAKALEWLDREARRAENAIDGLNKELHTAASNRLFRFSEQLKKAGISSEEATKMMNQYRETITRGQAKTNEDMSRQLRNMARDVSVQMGDVAVSLAGGMNPLLVMIQQGDQLRAAFARVEASGDDVAKSMQTAAGMIAKSFYDMSKAVLSFFVGSFKSAARAVGEFGEMLAGPLGLKTWQQLRNEMIAMNGLASANSTGIKIIDTAMKVLVTTLTASLVGVVAFGAAAALAFYKTQKQLDDLTLAVVQNGGSLGMSSESALGFAKSMQVVGVSTSAAIDLITVMAKEGGFLKSQLTTIIPVAKRMQEELGLSAEEAVKQFSQFNKDPVKALAELGQQTGLVSIETLKLVNKLKESGDASGASAIAMREAAKIQSEVLDKVRNDYSRLGLVLIETKKFFGNLWDSIKGLTYKDTAEEILTHKIKTTQSQITTLQEWLKGKDTPNEGDVKALQDLQKRLELQNKSLLLMQEKKIADEAETARNALLSKDFEKVAAFNKTTQDQLDKINEKHLTRNKYIEVYLEHVKKDIGNSAFEQIKLDNAKKLAGALWDQANAKKVSLSSVSDDNIGNLQKEYSSALSTAKALGADKLKVLDTYHKLGLKSESEYLSEQLALVQTAEDAQLNVVKDFQDKLLKAEEEQLAKIEKARLDAVNSAKANPGDIRDINKEAKEAVDKTKEAYRTLGLVVVDTKEKIISAADARAMQAFNSLAAIIKSVNDGIKQFGVTLQTNAEKRTLEIQQELELFGVYGSQVDAIKARNKVISESTSEINKLTAKLKEAEVAFMALQKDPNASDAQKLVAATAIENAKTELSLARIAATEDAEKAAIDAVVMYNLKEWKQTQDGITDVIVTALFEGGGKGGKKLRDMLIAELKKPITMVVNAIVSSVTSGITQSIAGNAAGSAAGNMGGSLLGSAAGSMMIGGSSIAAIGGSFTTGISAGIAGTDLTAAIAAYDAAGMTGVSAGLSAGSMLGAAVPWIAAAMALYAIYEHFDTSGTPHTGASASYSAAGGTRTGMGVAGVGLATDTYSKDVETTMAGMSKGIVNLLDQTALKFGKTAGYEAATAFADDSSKDGSWGSLVIKKLGETVAGFGTEGHGRWPGKEFADGKKGIEEFTNAVAADVKNALEGIGLPAWASAMLDRLGDAPTIDQLSAVVDMINGTQEALLSLGRVMPMFANLTDETVTGLLNAFGGIQNMSQVSANYYQNFFTEADKVQGATKALQDAFKSLGVEMPTDRLQYRVVVEKALADGNEDLAAKLLMLSSAFAELNPWAEEVEQNVRNVAESLANLKNEGKELGIQLLTLEGRTQEANAATRALATEGFTALELAAYDSNQMLKEQVAELTKRNDLESQLFKLTHSTAEIRAKELETLSPANQELQTLVWSLQDVADAARDAATAETALVNQRKSLESQLFELTASAAEKRASILAVLNDAESQRLQNLIWQNQDAQAAAKEAADAEATRQTEAQRLAKEVADYNKKVEDEAYGLETKRLSLLGETAKLRERELALVDPANQAARKEIWAIEDKIAADKLAAEAAAEAAQVQQAAADAATKAAQQIRDAWQSITDSIFEEVARIRGLITGTGTSSFAQAQFAFSQASTAALAGDQDAAKSLPKLSQTLLQIAGEQARSMVELSRIQMLTANSLANTGGSLVSQYGLTIPQFANGGSYAGGLALVGERGPELINFNSPGFVHDSSSSATLLNSSNMAAAIDRLNANIDGLRTEIRADVKHNAKVASIMDRVASDGETLAVRVIV